jgi:hypothetical protein
MSSLATFFCSSIGRKFLMAITGLILIGFIVGHLVGNFQIFQHPDKINGYAQFLHQTGPLLWIARLGLLASVVIHIWAATVLTLEKQKGPRGTGLWAKPDLDPGLIVIEIHSVVGLRGARISALSPCTLHFRGDGSV